MADPFVPVAMTERQRKISHNVRILMKMQDVTQAHLGVILDISISTVNGKLGGRIAFQEDEIDKLADFFNTTPEGLLGNIELNPPPKYRSNGKIPDPVVEETEPVAPLQPAAGGRRQDIVEEIFSRDPAGDEIRSAVSTVRQIGDPRNGHDADELNSIIAATEDSKELQKLQKKMFFACLSGKIEDLAYYIRNNLLVKAISTAGLTGVPDSCKQEYVEHFLRQYSEWKDNLVTDIEDVTEIILASASQADVLRAVYPTEKTPVRDYLKNVVKGNTGDDNNVDIRNAVDDLTLGIEQIEQAKKRLEDYLRRNAK